MERPWFRIDRKWHRLVGLPEKGGVQWLRMDDIAAGTREFLGRVCRSVQVQCNLGEPIHYADNVPYLSVILVTTLAACPVLLFIGSSGLLDPSGPLL
jgi:hypothetical protein